MSTDKAQQVFFSIFDEITPHNQEILARVNSDYSQFIGWLIVISSTLLAFSIVNPEEVKNIFGGWRNVVPVLWAVTIATGILDRLLGLWIAESRRHLLMLSHVFATLRNKYDELFPDDGDTPIHEQSVKDVMAETAKKHGMTCRDLAEGDPDQFERIRETAKEYLAVKVREAKVVTEVEAIALTAMYGSFGISHKKITKVLGKFEFDRDHDELDDEKVSATAGKAIKRRTRVLSVIVCVQRMLFIASAGSFLAAVFLSGYALK